MRLTTDQKKSFVLSFLESNLSIREFSEQHNLSKSSLYTWTKKFNLSPATNMTNLNYSPEQRFAIVLETAAFSEAQLSQYCREKGLYPEQIQQWKQACIGGVTDTKPAGKVSSHIDKKRIKSLEKELVRKDKALAETAALLVLTKKLQVHFGAEEE